MTAPVTVKDDASVSAKPLLFVVKLPRLAMTFANGSSIRAVDKPRKRRGGNDADAALADVSGGDEVDGCTAQRRIDREVAARPRRRERHIVRAGIERTRYRKAFGVVQRERAVRGREAAEIDKRIRSVERCRSRRRTSEGRGGKCAAPLSTSVPPE